MLYFQYAYYIGREADKPQKSSQGLTKAKTVFALGAVEVSLLASAYLAVARIILGHRLPRLPMPSFMSPIAVSFIVAFILCYINVRLIGRENRIHRYKEIFDGWSKERRLRWKISSLCLLFGSILLCFVIGEVTQNGVNPQNWKYQW
jgi:Na+/melibiose symporter-like transporter